VFAARAVEHDHVWVVVGWVLVEALVWPVLVDMAFVCGKDAAGVPLVVDQHRVRCTRLGAAEEPFGVAVRPRRSRRS